MTTSEKTQLDAEINDFAREYPEKSQAEIEQEAIDADARENWGSSYPEYEGPGYTEPPLNWCGENHDPDWTFTGWAEDRGYPPDEIAAVNAQFPDDGREMKAMEANRRLWTERDEYPAWEPGSGRMLEREPGQ
jgi:hypothetical protein